MASSIAREIPNDFGAHGSECRKESRVPLRFVFLTNFIPPYWKPVLEQLSARYGQLRVLVSTEMEPDRKWAIDWQGLDVVRQRTITLQHVQRHPRRFRDTTFVHFPVDTLSQLWKFRPDVVLSAEMGFRSLLAAVYRRLRPASRLIVFADVSEHSEAGRGWMRFFMRRTLRRGIDAFLVTGESGARYVRRLGVEESRIFKVPYATAINKCCAAPIRAVGESERRLLYVGQLIERKGLLPFVACLVNWLEANAHAAVELTVAGDGPLRGKLEQIKASANLQIKLLGDVPYEAVRNVYARADIFVFPTLADTWGIAVSEAMAAGLPVLGSLYSQAVEELVEDGRNGWVFRADDAGEMYGAIARSMNTSREALQQMGECARNIALQLTPERVAGLIDSVLQQVAKVR